MHAETQISGVDGRLVGFSGPTGGSFGTTFTTWIEELHEAGLWRWPMQVALSIIGLGVTVLSITGILIWQRKWRARTGKQKRGRERTAMIG